jgi:hypothetical protein
MKRKKGRRKEEGGRRKELETKLESQIPKISEAKKKSSCCQTGLQLSCKGFV